MQHPTRLSQLLRHRILLLGAALIVLGGVTSGVALAVTSPVSSGVAHACYNPATGTFQLKVNSTCPASGNKTPINWNVQGASGNTGATGPAAPAPVEQDTWTASVAANAADSTVRTHTKFGSGARIDGLTGKLTGNFTFCGGGFAVSITLLGDDFEFVHWSATNGSNVTNLAATGPDGKVISTGTVIPLVEHVTCYDGAHHPLKAHPAFSFSATIQWTHPAPRYTIP